MQHSSIQERHGGLNEQQFFTLYYVITVLTLHTIS